MAKVVLVTGAQQGIGAAMARAFAGAGYDVAINWLDDESRARAVAAQVEQHGRRALLVHGNVGRIAEGAALVARTVDGLGGIDVLINNAGIFPRVKFLEMDEAIWDAVHDVNLKGSAFCGQAAARAMVAAGTKGCIINLSSQAMRGAPLGVHYSATKAGVAGLTRAMALALAPEGIRVNAIAPGLTDTAQPRYGSSEAELAQMATALPIPRMGTPEDIAGLALYLASDAASWVTGQTMHINGGSYMP